MTAAPTPPTPGALPSRTVRGGDGIAWAPFTTPAGGTWRDGPAPVDISKMGARTTRDTDALVVPRLLVEHRRNGEARPVYAEPTSALTTGGDAAQGGSHHSLVTPAEGLVVADVIYTRNYGHTDPRFLSRRVTDPLGPITAKDHTALVIPFRRGSRAYPATASALSTIATHEAHGLLARLGIDLLDCHFRMLQADRAPACAAVPRRLRRSGQCGRADQAGRERRFLECRPSGWGRQSRRCCAGTP